ncbi:hypothetical protein HS088_TW14G00232 [Tripterygium wilfordii]|uniref:Uncharacterized protein n=1 Tax=Tripterygium wilfordii TaxID=458696 RepID=A0A7J7CQ16_TRIWF|nr:uncharacterized protein LOC120014374 [Tripterygium wilfordii]KAF5736098.1 hypothetical protein HS088_TW14G00232 [Tripterygium wilfordii]
MSDREDNDSDAPEEFTTEQGVKQNEEIIKVQKENKARVVREGKERRRQWAQKLTPRPSKGSKEGESVQDRETETEEQSLDGKGMLPHDIVELLAAREKQVFLSDSEDEKTEVRSRKRKAKKSSGFAPVILKDIPPPRCLESSLEFLKKKKMQVHRSSAVLNNSNQALRLISTSGLLNKK